MPPDNSVIGVLVLVLNCLLGGGVTTGNSHFP